MKKIALLFLTMVTLLSCGNEVEFNTPGFQGNKDYNLWRATYFNATIGTNGMVTITAGNNNESMIFTVVSSNTGTYTLSDATISKANFVDFNDTVYSTSNTPDPSVTIYPEIGEIVITESTPGTLTGTFRFNAFTSDGLNSVGFNEGVFYRVPIIN
ncbi:hypothetical protein GCM10011531_10550 [Aquaticitalea lipolytica]|uniref:Lipid-binding hydrolase n=1 Tax=Aquaticitalea lipolytica TaxID=1247562 RepID=A0A8J2TMN4_9FLAO|nr:DUF6252 family protein [Aquaticitalea lipolytica]GFZ82059.1 hypothetical protein GCM10011531_10550 [Aquaticitalea lipolytica]